MNRNYTEEIHGKEARDALLRGAERVYKLVSTTLGPRGRNVVINKGFDIDVIHDGVKVSRYVYPKDMFEKAGADLLKEAAERHVSNVGDGTTLTTVLGYNIAKEAMTLIDSGVNAMSLRKGLEKGRDIIISEVNKKSIPVETVEQKINVATVSAQDEELGKMIGETYEKIGLEGVLIAEESKSQETTLEHEEGISLTNGLISPYFVTNPRTMTGIVKDPYILITDRELDDVYEFLDLSKNVLEPNNIRNIVIIAANVSGTLLSSLVETKRQGMMNVMAIKAPNFGQYRREFLEDIATMTGGELYREDSQKSLDELTIDDLGRAEKVVADRDGSTILNGKGLEEAISERIESIKYQIKTTEKEFDREKLRERLSKMTGGVYVIKTGGSTEIEMLERKERVDDAILATRAAIESGIVPGGEITYLSILEKLKPENSEEEYAYRILKNALVKPFEKLLENAGMNPGYYMAKLEKEPFGHGVDVTDGNIKDMVEEGIVDPAEVLTEGLRSAVSVATMIITSDAVTAWHEQDKK